MLTTDDPTHLAPRLDLAAFLTSEQGWILDAAETRLTLRPVTSYAHAGPRVLRQRLEALYESLVVSVRMGSPDPIELHAANVAGRRFSAGFSLGDVLAAYNALEEAIWRQILRVVGNPAEHGPALSRVSTLLGRGKDTLATAYLDHAVAQARAA